jgi:hypothetical protein
MGASLRAFAHLRLCSAYEFHGQRDREHPVGKDTTGGMRGREPADVPAHRLSEKQVLVGRSVGEFGQFPRAAFPVSVRQGRVDDADRNRRGNGKERWDEVVKANRHVAFVDGR